MARFFVSDFHFIGEPQQNDKILNWERIQFKSVKEHNDFLLQKIQEWADRLRQGDEFWFLGDWGCLEYLPAMDAMNEKEIKTYMVMGNHDRDADFEIFWNFFDKVYRYPVFLSNRLIVSHFPQAVWPGCVNLYGHLHGMKINNPHYIACSVNDIDYNLVTEKHINSAFSKIEKFDTSFLFEPWADMYQATKRDTSDLVVDKDGNLDVSATRAYWKTQGWLK